MIYAAALISITTRLTSLNETDSKRSRMLFPLYTYVRVITEGYYPSLALIFRSRSEKMNT
jgi:hypothetical protein